jgi:hypothetical protein
MKRIIILALAFILLLSTFVACSANSMPEQSFDRAESKQAYDYDDEMAEESAPMAVEVEAAPAATRGPEPLDGSDSGAGAQNMNTDRKLIYYANYRIETTQFTDDYDFILNKLNSVNGYVQNSSVSGQPPTEYGDRGRYAELSLRVPVDKYNDFIASLNGVGNVLSKSQSTDDVSAQYFDTESRINVINTKIERLEDLLKRTQELKDIIELENALSDAMYELDRLQGQKRQLDSLVDFTTVYIDLTEVNEISTISQQEAGLGQKIKDVASESWDLFVRVLEGLLLVIIGGMPVWIFAGLIVFIIIRVKRKKRRKKAALAKRQEGETK